MGVLPLLRVGWEAVLAEGHAEVVVRGFGLVVGGGSGGAELLLTQQV